MKKYIIEREIGGIGSKDLAGLREAARTSNAALAQLGSDIQWQESYVTGDKTFCVYLATDEEIVREHARMTGFPATVITEVRRMFDPTTAAVSRLRS
jgi:hypothetical protein